MGALVPNTVLLRERCEANYVGLELPLDLPSRNVLDKMHWRKRHRLRKDLTMMIPRVPAWHPQGEGKVVLTIERVLGPKQRMFDHDNVVGGCKQLIDALVETGYLVDDSPRHLVLIVRQNASERSEGPAVRVSIRPAETEADHGVVSYG